MLKIKTLSATGLGFGLSLVMSAAASPYVLDSPDGVVPQNGAQIRTSLPALPFSVGERLKANVDFWIKIYTQVGVEEGLIHDAKYLDKVFEKVDLSGPHGRHRARQTKLKWKNVLLSLHQKTKNTRGVIEDPTQLAQLSDDEKHVYQLFRDLQDPAKFLNAAHRKRLRFQLGQRDRFLEGLRYSGKYLKPMEEVFAREGLPIELTRLPFVESSFNVRARSKVGASGIWQFMPSTARLFMRVDGILDERNDPIRAAQAAARLLRLNFESLGSWPLAVTAYNHGRKGMMRAVRRVGSESLEDLVQEYRSRSFGFASSNFFVELLAAIEVEKNAEHYFGPVARHTPDTVAQVAVPDAIRFTDLVKFLGWDAKQMKTLNPALSDAVVKGKVPVPAGYSLNLPITAAAPGGADEVVKAFLASYEAIPELYKARGGRRRIGSVTQKGL